MFIYTSQNFFKVLMNKIKPYSKNNLQTTEWKFLKIFTI